MLSTKPDQLINNLIQNNANATRYVQHLSTILLEACSILDRLEVEVDLSPALLDWWMHHKPQTPVGENGEINGNQIVSASGNPIGSGVELGVQDNEPVLPSSEGSSGLLIKE